MSPNLKYPILLFDGVCNLCNDSVQWILLHDKKGLFSFVSLQSKLGKELLSQRGMATDRLDTVVLMDEAAVYLRSDASLEVLRRLGGFWSIGYILKIFPLFIRDAVYNWVAKNRYRWFGSREECLLPRPEWKERFLDGEM